MDGKRYMNFYTRLTSNDVEESRKLVEYIQIKQKKIKVSDKVSDFMYYLNFLSEESRYRNFDKHICHMLESCDIGECSNEIKLKFFYIYHMDNIDFSISFSQLPSYEVFVDLLVIIGDNHMYNPNFLTSEEIIDIYKHILSSFTLINERITLSAMLKNFLREKCERRIKRLDGADLYFKDEEDTYRCVILSKSMISYNQEIIKSINQENVMILLLLKSLDGLRYNDTKLPPEMIDIIFNYVYLSRSRK